MTTSRDIQVEQARINATIAADLNDLAGQAAWRTRWEALKDTPTTSEDAKPLLPQHIFVCVHGIYGKPSDSEHIANALKHTFGPAAMVVQSSANTHKTHTGVRQMGTNLAIELLDILKDHRTQDNHKLTIVGHSLGGIIGRYALIYLQHALQELQITPMTFATLCTPHLGSRRPGGHLFKEMWKIVVHSIMSISVIYGQTGMDLLLEDDVDAPLLQAMSLPDSAFMAALGGFQHRTAIAMIQGDHIVPYASAAIHPRVLEPAFIKPSDGPWQWTLSYSGFDHTSAFGSFLAATYPEDANDDPLDVFGSASVDERHEVAIPPGVLEGLCSMSWRRLNLFVSYGGLFQFFWLSFHTWPLGIGLPKSSRSREFIDVLVRMLVDDHDFQAT
ncbi:hypothetical protein Ae201684_010490 [Aphanomyces euteiches]|uniref:DUF676 domain-containing protein n=1 Tax=Aphanomyces euteiches TaxID=100861 RepID=A0A6G0WY03_9STRA|nr:hypothetical protein Ae201684_010490 [Aphanomyces euteiches]